MLSELEINFDDLYFFLGSLIYPKKMVLQDNNESKRAEIYRIHRTLYQYKNEYLKDLLSSNIMVMLLTFYLKENKFSRIVKKLQNTTKLDSYIEQIEKMLSINPSSPHILKVIGFSLDDLKDKKAYDLN